MPDPFGVGHGAPVSSSDSFLVNDDRINPCIADQPGDVNDDCTVDIADLAVISEHWMQSTRQD